MAIGRVAGPMLLPTLDRQGIDLNFVTDPGTGEQSLLFLDFSNFQVGINTSVVSERLTVDGNITVNSYIKTVNTDQHLYLEPNGEGQVIISNVNVIKGNINASDIGVTTPAVAYFTTANTSSKATFSTAQVQSLTPGRIVFSDGEGLTDDPDMLFFTANNTFYATNIESAGTVGYANLVITGEFIYTPGDVARVPFFEANGMITDSPNMKFFAGNNVFSVSNVQLTSQSINQVAYTNTSNVLVGSSVLTFDGFTLNSSGTTVLGSLSISGRTIISTGVNQDIYIVPNGAGAVSVQEHRISDVQDPVLAGDAVNKKYVDDRISVSSVNSILQGASSVVVRDNGLGEANVVIVADGVEVARFEQINSYINDIKINDSVIGTVSGPMILEPFNNERIQMFTSSALTLPNSDTASRPLIPVTGDFRYNTDLGTVEWYTGFEWVAATGNLTIATQTITPNGVDDTYTLDQSASSESVLININGTVQQPSAAYSVVGDQVTFVEVPLISDIIEVRFLSARPIYAANPIFVSTQYANVSTSGTIVDNFYVTQYRSASYEFTVKRDTASVYQLGEAHLVHNGLVANVQASVKTSMGSATPLISWTTNVDAFGVVQLIATAADTNTVVKLHRTYFNDL